MDHFILLGTQARDDFIGSGILSFTDTHTYIFTDKMSSSLVFCSSVTESLFLFLNSTAIHISALLTIELRVLFFYFSSF